MHQRERTRLLGFESAKNPRAGLDIDLPHSMKIFLLSMTGAVHSHIMKTGTFVASISMESLSRAVVEMDIELSNCLL